MLLTTERGLNLEKIYLDSNIFIAFIKSELGKGFKLMSQDVEDFFRKARGKYIIVLSDHALKGIHYSDALHAALAINSKCDTVVTFNIKDFEPVKNLIEVKEPNELVY